MKNYLGAIYLLALLVVPLTACQTPPVRQSGDPQAIRASLEEWPGGEIKLPKTTDEPSAKPLEANSAAMPIISMMPPQKHFDLSVEQAPVRALLMGLVKGTPYNMVVHPEVSGELSLDLKGVTIEDVMQTLRNVYGYEFQRTATGYEVFATSIQSRLYHVNYLNVRRDGESKIQVSSGQLTENNTGIGSTNNSSKNTGASGSKGMASSQVDTLSQSNFWEEIKQALQAIIGEQAGNAVIVNPQSGIIIVRALPKTLRDVEEYLVTTQAIIQRQVVLEAKILEVELNDGFQSGINWSALRESGNNSGIISQTGGGTVLGSTGVSEIRGNTGILDPTALDQVQGSNTSAFGGVFSAALNLGDFTAFIELLKTQGDVHVLSSPRVSTVNNQKAVIKVGADEFFVTNLNTNNTNASGAATQTVDVELTPFFSGVALDVIPQIDEVGTVTLHVHPSVSEVQEKIKEVSINATDAYRLPLAYSTIRESDSIVRAHSGQVVVIGGLMQNIKENSTAGVPLLSQLPFLGALFRHEKQTQRKTELVILLRPVVVDDNNTWDNYLTGTKQSMNRLFPVEPVAAQAEQTPAEQ